MVRKFGVVRERISHTILLRVRVLGFPQQTITRFVVSCWGASPHFPLARQDFEGAIR